MALLLSKGAYHLNNWLVERFLTNFPHPLKWYLIAFDAQVSTRR